MPCIEISLPAVPSEVRARLAAGLTTAFSESTRFPADILGVRFFEYEGERAASGGQLSTADDERPYLHMLLYSPRLSRDQKQRLAEALTTAFTDAVGRPSWTPVIHICEHPYDNVVVDGKLLSDAFPQLAEKRFYYATSDD